MGMLDIDSIGLMVGGFGEEGLTWDGYG